MKIGIDIRALLEGRHTGVEEYTINLLRFLFEIDRENEYLLFSSGRKKLKVKSEKLKVSTKHFPISNRVLNLSFKCFGRPQLDKLLNRIDVFWAPNINLIPTTSKCRKIVTFHDLSFERHPEFFSLKRRLWHQFINPAKLAQEAGAIITVSESTRQDLIDIYRVEPEKIKVVYSGVGKKFKVLPISSRILDKVGKSSKFKVKKIKKKYHLPEEFIPDSQASHRRH